MCQVFVSIPQGDLSNHLVAAHYSGHPVCLHSRDPGERCQVGPASPAPGPPGQGIWAGPDPTLRPGETRRDYQGANIGRRTSC